MKALLSMLAALGLMGVTHAVTLQAGEWFIDTDPGEGSGTSFSGFSGGTADLNVTIPAGTLNALSEGAHLLGVRFQDSDGGWGQIVWRSFLNQHPHGGLAAGEYFFDVDPGEGGGTPITGLSGDTTSMDFTIPAGIINGLTEGAHLLGVRFQDGDGEWGQVTWRGFDNQHPHGGLVAGEYFFNTDPGFGSGIPLSGVSGNSHDVDHTVSLVSPPVGANLLGVRLQDGDGEWGHTAYRVFFNPEAGSRDLNRVEFVVYRGGASVSSGSVFGDGSLALNVTHEPSGLVPILSETLLLEVQVVDDSDRRSHKVFREIPVEEFTQSFQDLFFSGAEQSDALVSGDDADPDGDRLANIIEQLMGLNPREPDAGVETTGLAQLAGGKEFSFRSASESAFNPGTSTFMLGDLSVEIEVTSDFSGWSRAIAPADFSVSTSGAANGDGSFRHVVDLVSGANTKRFYRLRVTRP